MVHITQGVEQKLIFTAYEREIVAVETYRLKLYRDNELKFTLELGEDLSEYPERFNLFNLEDTEAEFGFNQMGRYPFDYKLIGITDDVESVLEVGEAVVYNLNETPIFTQREQSNVFTQRNA